MTSPNHVFLAWQCSESRRIMPIGRLVSLGEQGYEFSYIRAVSQAQELGFQALVAFPELNVIYRSAQLPALFSNRVMPMSRPDYPAFVSELGLAPGARAIDVLGRSGGRRTTDELEIFNTPTKLDGGLQEMHFLARGVRHIPGAENTITTLNPGDQLLVLRDEQNPHAPHARLLRTSDTKLVGFLPDYLALELTTAAVEPTALVVTVEKANLAPTPVHHRLLCKAQLPSKHVLFAGDEYLPLVSGATPVAA